MWSKPETRRQGFHTDYITFGEEFSLMSYGCIIGFGDYCYLWTATEKEGEIIYERVHIPFGSAAIFTGNMVHAGAEYEHDDCFRIHKYIDSPNMIHGIAVNQDYNTYNDLTAQLNAIM